MSEESVENDIESEEKHEEKEEVSEDSKTTSVPPPSYNPPPPSYTPSAPKEKDVHSFFRVCKNYTPSSDEPEALKLKKVKTIKRSTFTIIFTFRLGRNYHFSFES